MRLDLSDGSPDFEQRSRITSRPTRVGRFKSQDREVELINERIDPSDLSAWGKTETLMTRVQ